MNRKKDTLYNKLERYEKSDYIPFHMPGHKRNYERFGMESVAGIDITEIDGFDDYHYPKGIIRQIEDEAAEIYGADDSFYLVNGSSAGLLAAISASVNYGDSILIARNCHKAVYNAVYLNGLVPEYLYPEMNPEYGMMGQICPKEVKAALENSQAKVVVITSPTYEGIVSNIREIATVCHEKEAVLIVDEAHGAHFNFHDIFPKTALACGADMVIESLHKTLPSYTQTAILHVHRERVDVEKVRKYLSIYQTSSPSYIFMAGMNRCLDYMVSKNGKEENEKYIASLLKLRNQLEKLNNIRLFPENAEEKKEYYDYDISKIVLCVPGQGVWLYEKLFTDYHIQAEMAAKDYIILMTAIGDKTQWYEVLENALEKLDKEVLIDTHQNHLKTQTRDVFQAKVAMPPRTALEMDVEKVSVKECEGRISAEWAYAYPPGIPLIYPGEEITGELLIQMEEMRNAGVFLKGLQDDKGDWIQCIK